ncbi:MFS transporter [Kribbella lupini]|uniref:MFS transporter n=2 Tax=Kribbella lupini TaxID=291602 RepID=A0ABN2AFB4_9ACTN
MWPLRIALCGGYFLVLLDVTVVNVALPELGAGLGTSSYGLAWVVDAYTAPLAVLLLVAGALGDRYGHRRFVLWGYVGFGAASVVCALAQALPMVIAGRAIQGVCAAFMLPGTLALLIAAAPDERGRTVGLWAAVGGAALPAGPLLGGVLVDLAGWRAVFWLNVPFIAAALLPIVKLRERPKKPANRRLRPALSVPVRALVPACAVAGVMNFCALGALFVLTQVFQTAHHLRPLAAGLLLLPAMLPLPVLGAPAGRLTDRLGPWRTSAAGLTIAATGFAGLAVTVGSPPGPALLGSLAVWGVGLGVLTPAIVSAALQAAPVVPGTASGASNTARQAGGALGVATFGAVVGADLTRAPWVLAGAALAFALAAAYCWRRNRDALPVRR